LSGEGFEFEAVLALVGGFLGMGGCRGFVLGYGGGYNVCFVGLLEEIG